jgi:hypothetical protein
VNRSFPSLLIGALACLAPATVLAGGGDPNQTVDRPRPAEVAERVGKLLDATPHQQVEVAGAAKLDYAHLPVDAHAVAMAFGETLSGSQDPRAKGLPLDRYVRIFEGQIQELVDQRLADVGTLEVLAPLKMKGKTIAPGKYTVGIALQGGHIAGLVLREAGNARARPVAIKLKLRRPELEPGAEGAVAMSLAQKDGQPGFELVCSLRGEEAASTPLGAGDAPAAPAAAAPH